MTIFIHILFGFIGFIIFTSLIWRFFSSRGFSLPCPSWLGWLLERENPLSTVNRSTAIIEHLDLQEGMIVLDAGCGPGRLTIPVARKVGSEGQVVALDIQAGMLNQVRKKAREAHLENIRFIEAGLGEKKLEQNKFDRALLITVLGEIPDKEAALKELFDSLKPGGILSITEFIFDPHFQRRSIALKLIQAAGFHEKRVYGSWWEYTMLAVKPMY